MLKRVTALLVFVCFVLTFGTVFAEGETFDVQVEVTFGQTKARSMLAMINDFRTGSDAWYWNADDTEKVVLTDLQPLTYDSRLEQVAMQRAAELVLRYSHTRPDDTGCGTALDEFGVQWWSRGENIAAGYYRFDEAADVFEAWQETNEPYSGQGHRRNMLNANFTRIGIGYASVGDYHFWAQAFARYDDAQDPLGAANNGVTVVTVRVSDGVVTSMGELTTETDSIRLNWGETAALPRVSSSLALSGTWPSGSRDVIVAVDGWTSGDPLCASVDSASVTGLAIGSTVITANVRGTTLSLPVTVAYAGRLTPDTVLPDNLRTLGQEALRGTHARAVSLPEGLQSVESMAFAYCPDLRQVTFNGSGASVAADAFTGCPAGLVVFCPAGEAAQTLSAIQGITVVPFR